MLAYRIPDVSPADCLDRMRDGSHAGLARIALAGPWQFSAHPEGGALATWKGAPVPRVDDLGEAVACPDGLMYYRPKVMPAQADLAKPSRSEWEIDVDLANGMRLTVLLAASEPRRLRFVGPDAVGDALTEYGQLARRVQRRLAESTPDAPITAADADVRRLLVLAVGQRYRVTDDLLDDLGWISTADVDPLLQAIQGADPKACAAATGT